MCKSVIILILLKRTDEAQNKIILQDLRRQQKK